MTTIDELNDAAILKAYRTGTRKHLDRAGELVRLMELHAPTLLHGMVQEHKFCVGRKWRFDLAWPDLKAPLAVEVNGGRWQAGGGRHNTPADYEKMQMAAVLGWRVFPVLAEQLTSDPFGLLARLHDALGVPR